MTGMTRGIRNWPGRHEGPKWIRVAKGGPNRHEKRNAARVARRSVRSEYATKSKYKQVNVLKRITAALFRMNSENTVGQNP